MHDPSIVTSTRPRRLYTRGFTLVELMVVVAIIGVMAVLAIVGYRKYIHSAQGTEAKSVIQGIRGAQEAYRSEMLQYLNISTSIDTWYPSSNVNDKRINWNNPSGANYDNWKVLGVNPDGPVRFRYACVAGVTPVNMVTINKMTSPPTPPTLAAGTPWYVIQAVNDHDGNGVYAVFGSTSLGPEVFSDNETE